MSLLKDKYPLLLCLCLLTYTGTSFAERADRDQPLKIEADHVIVDDANQTSTFEGNVQIHQGTLLIEASKALIKQDTKGFSQVIATGQLVHLRQKRDNIDEFAEGYGERIEYDNQTEIANIYGQARIKREGDDVRGEHIVYNTQTGVFQVFGSANPTPDKPGQGRVTIVIQPKDKAPKKGLAPDTPSLPATP